jgi:hypothetical protein
MIHKMRPKGIGRRSLLGVLGAMLGTACSDLKKADGTASKDAKCTPTKVQKAQEPLSLLENRISRISNPSCLVSEEYKCYLRVFSPTVLSGKESAPICFDLSQGEFCVEVTTIRFDTSVQTRLQASEVPLDHYQYQEANCYYAPGVASLGAQSPAWEQWNAQGPHLAEALSQAMGLCQENLP